MENSNITNAENTKEGSAQGSYPKIRLKIRFHAPPVSLGHGTGASFSGREMAIDIEPAEVGKMMSALGWSVVEKGQAELAVASLSCLLEEISESAAWMCACELESSQSVEGALDRIDVGWRDAIEGGLLWRPAALSSGLWVESSVRLQRSDASRVCMPSFEELVEDYEVATQSVASTIVDQCARLGAKAYVGWSNGFGTWRGLDSKLPEKWSWPKLGAALCVEIEDSSFACLSLSKKGVERLAKSPLGMAIGPRSALGLLSSCKPLRVVCGSLGASRSYTRCALPGLPGVHYPCHAVLARRSWGEHSGASSAEAMAALAELAGNGADILEWVPPCEVSSGVVDMGVAQSQWLASVAARIQAKALARKVPKAKVGSDSGKRGPARL